ncbi:MAG: type VI secretion system protein TssL [Gammaproteobacteria bacterium]|uniref:Flagellar motor rotation protein MotB n=1 Tax=Marinobacter nitratireducens TaxID=1137280 RepID=A0A072NBD3_9GAMM|nr:OmpA family protein [Marinobacter nitratireducens]KEF30375.1 Flagellar motor rotation protein MotB [Marinobacter nitratireducens]TNE75284.1 MAG: type VI secretion system protein TssL [Gammaproteobacteria bacterium]TNE97625.1 MAG: type VI secretion system protein TssL [Gammaproteobacteria bacterium]
MEVTRQKQKIRLKSQTPAWIVTFADLATLLLTFFILLLSFAEMDVQKYRAMANSMSVAFGSSNVLADDVGGSPITLVESDTVSLPEPSETLTSEPEFIDERDDSVAPTKIPGGVIDLASRLIREMEAEVASDALSVNYDPNQVVIRFSEESTFRSGEADIKPEMIPIIDRVVNVLSACTGDVLVSGFTDNRPISSSRFRSNWDLSAARAVSVVHELVMNQKVPADRVMAAGRAETNPLAPNDSPENRARNRRVEIAIRNPECDESVSTEVLPVEINP